MFGATLDDSDVERFEIFCIDKHFFAAPVSHLMDLDSVNVCKLLCVRSGTNSPLHDQTTGTELSPRTVSTLTKLVS